MENRPINDIEMTDNGNSNVPQTEIDEDRERQDNNNNNIQNQENNNHNNNIDDNNNIQHQNNNNNIEPSPIPHPIDNNDDNNSPPPPQPINDNNNIQHNNSPPPQPINNNNDVIKKLFEDNNATSFYVKFSDIFNNFRCVDDFAYLDPDDCKEMNITTIWDKATFRKIAKNQLHTELFFQYGP